MKGHSTRSEHLVSEHMDTCRVFDMDTYTGVG